MQLDAQCAGKSRYPVKRSTVYATLHVADGGCGQAGRFCKLLLGPSRLLSQASEPAAEQLVNVHDVTFR